MLYIDVLLSAVIQFSVPDGQYKPYCKDCLRQGMLQKETRNITIAMTHSFIMIPLSAGRLGHVRGTGARNQISRDLLEPIDQGVVYRGRENPLPRSAPWADYSIRTSATRST